MKDVELGELSVMASESLVFLARAILSCDIEPTLVIYRPEDPEKIHVLFDDSDEYRNFLDVLYTDEARTSELLLLDSEWRIGNLLHRVESSSESEARLDLFHFLDFPRNFHDEIVTLFENFGSDSEPPESIHEEDDHCPIPLVHGIEHLATGMCVRVLFMGPHPQHVVDRVWIKIVDLDGALVSGTILRASSRIPTLKLSLQVEFSVLSIVQVDGFPIADMAAQSLPCKTEVSHLN